MLVIFYFLSAISSAESEREVRICTALIETVNEQFGSLKRLNEENRMLRELWAKEAWTLARVFQDLSNDQEQARIHIRAIANERTALEREKGLPFLRALIAILDSRTP